MKHSRGFTLIELMIVVAIIAILTSLAVSVYTNYVGKSQLSEAFILADGLKTNVGEFYTQTGTCPSPGANGMPAATSYSGNYVASVDITPGGTGCVITSLMRAHTVAPKLQGKKLVLTMAGTMGGAINWQCSSDAASVYVPQTCQ